MRGQDPTKQTKPERKDQHESAFVQIERTDGRRTSKFLQKEEWKEQEEWEKQKGSLDLIAIVHLNDASAH